MENVFKYAGERKSHQTFNEVYFWTSVIKDWKHLLKTDEMKMIIITGNYVKNLLNTGFHQQSFMKREKMNLKY